MRLKELARIASPIGALLIILYFGIVGLLIADKTDDNELLYFAEILVALIIVIIATTIISRINLLQLIFTKNQIAVNLSPASFALYDIENQVFKTSDNLTNLIKTKNNHLSFDKFLSSFTQEDQLEIASLINSSYFSSGYNKVGIIKIKNEDNLEKYYRFICKLTTTKFGGRVIYFWLIDYTDVIKDEIELIELIKKYRVTSFELSQIIDNLPIAIWRIDENDKLIYSNAYYNEASKKYNLNIEQEYQLLSQENSVKKFIDNGKIKTLAFNKISLPSLNGSIGFCLDITNQESLNGSVKILENILEKLIDNVSVGFLILDQDLKIINYNNAYVSIFSLDSKILAQKPGYNYVLELLKENKFFPELKGYKQKHLQDIRQVKSYTTDLIHMPNGTTIKLTIIPAKDGNTILTYENITPNLELERELARAKLMFKSAVNLIEWPTIIISQNGYIDFINDLFIKNLFNEPQMNNIPSVFNELMTEKILNIAGHYIDILKNQVIECLELRKSEVVQFTIGKAKFNAHTIGLDDLSVILIIKKLNNLL